MVRALAFIAVFILAGCSSSTTSPGGASLLPSGKPVHPAGTSENCPAYPGGSGILYDGDFSQSPMPTGNNTVYRKGTVFAPGWKVTKHSIDFTPSGYWHMDGLCAVDADGQYATGGFKTSIFATKGGASYTVSFLMSGNPDCAPAVKTLKLEVGNQFTTFTWDTSNGNDVRHGKFGPETWSFIASRQTAVKFVSQDPPGTGCGAVVAAIAVTKN
jgi:hypothetical protein